MLPGTADTPLTDVEFLARSEHRVTALAALADRPRTRAALRELTGASPSTISRTLREFEARRWVDRDGHAFAATQPGAYVAARMAALLDRFETERALRDVWQWLPGAESGFTVEMGAGAVVTVAETEEPYGPVNRFASLLRETDRFRFVGVDVPLLEPCRDEFARRIVDGMRAEIVDPPSVARYVRSTYGDHCAGHLENGNLAVRLHDDLPDYGVSLFDDRIGISGYDPDSGTVTVFLDTDDPAAREWAEATYATYRRESRPFALETAVQ